MTDTVEGIMALADEESMGASNAAALRAAVERVIAERNGARNGVTQAAMVNGLLKERAERAEQRNEEQHRLLIKAEAERDSTRAELTNLQVAFNDWKVFHSTTRIEAERDALRALLVEARWRLAPTTDATLEARIDAAISLPKSPAHPPADLSA